MLHEYQLSVPDYEVVRIVLRPQCFNDIIID
ncbi:Uncharacterised protein [Rodentibacter pneumotropicus]|uniref:Uncharacterized protein n=1 Tax=Rodentibacter pneumotropicus TaxID=758 RepID=A0A3S4UNY4_9PAST|nr:Uncharacterised protein [Rodentibacter pneumotropicus]